MARIARAVAAGHPHHVTQRGNRRQTTFFCDEDYRLYLRLLREQTAAAGVEVWSYCLMPNHVHLILCPDDELGLAQAVGETHRRYTVSVNRRQGWTGYLRQGRFSSSALDEAHLVEAVRYLAINPVRAELTTTAGEWPWSSAAAFLRGVDDPFVTAGPIMERIGNWKSFVAAAAEADAVGRIRAGDRTGRPVGGGQWSIEGSRRAAEALGTAS